MSTLTAVEPTSTKAPILTEGDISPAIMMDFENAALNFFCVKVSSCWEASDNDYS